VVVQEVAFRGVDLGEVATAIRQAVAEEHEVPVSALVLVKPGGVPKTTSGKIQRRECRQLFLTGGLVPLGEWRDGEGDETRERLASKTSPRTPAEERLAKIWEEVLGLAPGTVGAEDNFFALGGDSLRGTQLLARLQEALGVEVSLEELFAAPTLADLAARIPPPSPARAHIPLGAGAPPLTSPQRRLWFLDQLEPGNPAYNLGIAVRLSGALDADALALALAEIVRRHEALRTVFRVLDDVPAQVVLPVDAVVVPLARVDVSVDAEPARAALDLERELAREPFELERGPLLRARLVGLAPDEHELHVAVHHIVADGWSFGVLLRELAILYDAFSRDLPSPLPELPVQYGEYARWLEGRLVGDALEPRIAVWKRRLGGNLPVLELPSDRPRPPLPSYRGAHATHVLPMALAGALRGLAGRRGASLFMALAAGFQALLGRLTAQDDVIVGTAVANRDRVELEGLIGFFVNTVPLRTDLSSEPSFDILLERVRGTVLEALAGREVPFERLVDELRLRRDLSVPPIVQVMLVLQNEPLEAPPVPGLALRGRETDNGTARFDLAVSLLDTEEGLAAVFKYSRDLFDAATIERLAGHFERLLAGAAAAPERRLSELPLLSAAERQQIVVDWNATDVPALTEAGCLHELIEAQVERTPEAVAVSCEGESLTYRELDRRANQLARHLRRLGVAPEVLVGVAVERSVELMVGLLGVLKAGGAYVPLDPSYPAERLAFMVEDAEVAVLLTQDRLLGLDAAETKDGKDFRDGKGVSLDNAAYCIYTSGSTGRPKGAVNTHRGIVNRLLWMQAEYGLVPGEGVLQKTPISFDVSVWELFWPLLVGARVVFARPGGQQDSAYLAELIQREEITTLHFVPSMLQVFLEEPRLGACSCLRRVITSGEALPRELEERFGALLGAELHNLYGPTEAAVDVTYWPCLREPEARTVPIGRPISNLRIHLLDPAGEPVPVGVPGHLHIGGVGLARGYWKRPELTAERFVPDGRAGGNRLYATGDLARWRPDGVIEFLGRIDHQVKIRGFRIELGEIEAALNAHPAVRESVVVSREGALAAYVALHRTDPTDPSDPTDLKTTLAAWLRARLPEHMVPATFVVLPAFPLNPSGKVDRKALPAPEDPHRSEETPWVAPRTLVEERLAALWRELLGVEQVGVLDDFFALGGDSIQGALLINRLQRELNAILYVMALFDAPTVGQLASYLEEKYRDALVAAGWIAPGEADTAEPADAATEDAEVAALTQHLATRFSPAAGRHGAAQALNRPAVFLLSPFRSGSTLLRVMLAGHPGLFAPPELELLGFETMGERRRVFSGRDSFSREGLLRAVMGLRACDAEEAAALLEEAEERDEPTPDFYRRLQEWVGGRLLIDKTPRYALDLPTLRRAEDWFEAPLYVHLVRHPVAAMQSYLEARMQEVYRFPLPPRRQAELVWRLGHAHVLEHLAAVPAARQHRILFEEMVRDPRPAMEDLCAFLGIGFAPAMLSPYEGERMTDGLHGAGRMMGDPKFHQHRGIDAGVADRWKDAPEVAWLSEATWALAARLGYEAPAAVAPRPLERPHVGEIDLPLSFAQQRLWFLEQLEPGSSAYHMPAAVRLAGELDVEALARACAKVERRHEVLRTVFPAVEGRPRQVIRTPRTDLLPLADLGALPEAARREEAERLAVAEALRPFDLAAGPLWRVRLLRLAPAEHVLLVNLHHIVCDGWSVGLATRELTAFYQDAFLPELPLQYADFAAWQRERLAGSVLDELLAYWKERLAGPLPVLDLPLDRPRPQLQTHHGARLPLALPAEAVAGLREMGRGQGATLFMVLVAAFQTLLHRYSGQDDVLIGTPVASRNRAEVEDLIGLFVNTLVLRSDLAGDPAFQTLLSRVRQVVLAAVRHEEMPFEKLVEELGVERTLDRSPLFSVMLVLQNALPGALELPGLTLERLDLDTRTAKFELTLDLAERPDGGLSGSLEYNTDLFEASTAARLARHFASLAAGAAAGARLSELPLLSPAERHELVSGWNSSAVAVPGDVRVHELILAVARRIPDSVAISFEGESLRYGEIAERAERLARRLARLGVGPDVLVGICAGRSPSLLVALLGVLAAGGAYVPLDPANPAERLGHILADAAAPVLLTERSLLAGLPPFHGTVVFLDEEEGTDREERAGAPLPRPLPEHLAYVLYTSGSTGRPKGVEVTQRSLFNFVSCMARRPGLAAGDVVMAPTTLSFDIAATELLLPLTVGARIELVSRETAADPVRLAASIEQAGATFLQATPSAWALLLDGGWAGRPSLTALAGGEALPRPLAGRLLARVAAVWNGYGPTETTVYSAFHRVEPDGRPVPIGRPAGNHTLHLLGRCGELVPLGVPGELCIGGLGLARGYRGRPDLTAERFVPNPFVDRTDQSDRSDRSDRMDEPGSRLYRTGDLARRLPNGEIEYLGRFDHQVKIRGFRIEIGEAEAAFLAHPAVRQCVVVAAGEGADRRLVAYVVRDGDLGWEALRAFLRERLPHYMVPSAAVFLDSLPLLPSGKVDRRRLPDPGKERPELEAAFVLPQTGRERLVAGIWQKVLGLDRVGIDDNFFDLGGHSLLAAEVHGKLRERFGTDLPLLELFRHPTVRALAGRLGGKETGGRLQELALGAAPEQRGSEDVAIVGMAGRFPGAADLDALWRNLRGGVESISFFSEAELSAAGVDPALLANPRYVRARAVLDGIELFDAAHFGLSPREAAITDPQQRLLLECSWEALERAGLDPGRFGGRIGVYAGSVFSTYLVSNLLPQAAPDESWQMVLSNDKDTLATRIAYKLNLRGPSLNVQTACSTSLVAVHLARQALLAGECDAALAGGVGVRAQQTSGYLFQEEGILSPDGHCRPFDAKARGTLFGSGAGMVVLKRLSDALASGDTIHAVIKSSAVNNDGSDKVGFMAPSVEGQAEVIARALALGGIDPETVTYVETHGSA
ncbi:MAG TPA: amino acid adenylation domain-containing protein, partial [Thermoanaerobaculia bacterium]|nr:amino acid adenylation domain-containing protein [Thermoanaerobaculia bacterium]